MKFSRASKLEDRIRNLELAEIGKAPEPEPRPSLPPNLEVLVKFAHGDMVDLSDARRQVAALLDQLTPRIGESR